MIRITARIFAIVRHGKEVDRVSFVGEEYTPSVVKDYLLAMGHQPPFEVKQIKEIKK